MFKGTRMNGREKGKPNLITAKVRDAFGSLLDDNLHKIQNDLDSLKPIERVRVLIELATFVIPKMKSIEVNDLTEKQVTQPLIINLENFGNRDKQLR